jgi:plasmid maintenance system antidote protein VapI
MRKKMLAPIHPGEILMEEFLKPLGITQYKLAKGNPGVRLEY